MIALILALALFGAQPDAASAAPLSPQARALVAPVQAAIDAERAAQAALPPPADDRERLIRMGRLDQAGRQVLLAHDATAQAAGARMTEAIYPLHIGAVGGPLMRWLTALSGLVPAFLLGTGFLFWLRRRGRG